jgi:hypothetical protein
MVVTEDTVIEERVPPDKTGITHQHSDSIGIGNSGGRYPLRSRNPKPPADSKQIEREKKLVKLTKKVRKLTIKDRTAFDEADQLLNTRLAGDWAIPSWANVASFKKWWNEVTIPVMGGTVWPVECSASKAHPHLTDKAEHLHELLALSTLNGQPSLAEATVDIDFAILVGGTGSPPHVDSISYLLSRHRYEEGLDDWAVELTLAVGYTSGHYPHAVIK